MEYNLSNFEKLHPFMLLLYPQLRGVQDIVPLIHARSVLLLNSLNLYKAILESKTGLNAIALTSRSYAMQQYRLQIQLNQLCCHDCPRNTALHIPLETSQLLPNLDCDFELYAVPARQSIFHEGVGKWPKREDLNTMWG